MAKVSPVRDTVPETVHALPGRDTSGPAAGDDGVDRPTRALDAGDPAIAAPSPLERDDEIGLERSLERSGREGAGPRLRTAPGTRLRDILLPARGHFVGRAAFVGLLLAAGGVAGWFGRDLTGGPRPTAGRAWAGLSRDALSAHRAYVLEVAHPVEVAAKDEAHLAQWLAQRLKRRIILPDLSDTLDLTLVGGRILPAGPDVAGQLMYADKAGTRVTVYLRTGERGEPALNYLREGEISTFAWVDRGTGYVVAAAMDRERLQKIARAIAQEFDMDAARTRRAL